MKSSRADISAAPRPSGSRGGFCTTTPEGFSGGDEWELNVMKRKTTLPMRSTIDGASEFVALPRGICIYTTSLPTNPPSERGIHAASTSPRARSLKRHECRAPVQGFNARIHFREILSPPLSSFLRQEQRE